MENNTNKKAKLPIFWALMGMLGVILVIVGIVLISNANNIKIPDVPEMGQPGWFEAEEAKKDAEFKQGATRIVGIFVLLVGVGIFFSSLKPLWAKIGIKTNRYIVNENKDDLKGTMEDVGDVVVHGVSKAIANHKEQSANATKTSQDISSQNGKKYFCRHCGAEIKPGSKFCTSCGKEQ